MQNLKELSKKFEHYETPKWAVEAILDKEFLLPNVIDPCTGTGVLTKAARARNHLVCAVDIHDWGFPLTCRGDFLQMSPPEPDLAFDMLMNPPFSKAVAFVKKSFEIGARKVVCFCPMTWWTSKSRRQFFNDFPPARIWACAERATCWRHDMPPAKRKNDTPTMYAWFVFEQNPSIKTEILRIYKTA